MSLSKPINTNTDINTNTNSIESENTNVSGAISCPLIDIEHNHPLIVCEYRSLYPEPFERFLKLYGNNMNCDIFFSYRDRYDVIDYVYSNKLNDYQTEIIKYDLIKAIKEIILLEKIKLKK